MASAPLPRGWTKRVRSSVLQAIGLAAAVLTVARARVRPAGLRAELERAEQEIALLREERDLKDSRWIRLAPRRRPHYTPTQCMRVLQLKAARGWSNEQTSEALMIDGQTLQAWSRRVDEKGAAALVQLTEPVNRFPDFVRYLVRQLKALCPCMGKVRIAQVLARGGLDLGVTTVGRILRETEPIPDDISLPAPATSRPVRAKRPVDLWHIDLTTVPIGGGFWVPWLPFAIPQRWPFCWWVLVVMDHVSRSVLGLSLHRQVPSAQEVQVSVNDVILCVGRPPRQVITDKGPQFRDRSWRSSCRARAIRPRFGAVGRHGSIAIAERFIRSLKTECIGRTRRWEGRLPRTCSRRLDPSATRRNQQESTKDATTIRCGRDSASATWRAGSTSRSWSRGRRRERRAPGPPRATTTVGGRRGEVQDGRGSAPGPPG